MKVRHGFVSNSSSSSFLINLGKKMPKTTKELKEALKLSDGKIAVTGEAVFETMLAELTEGRVKNKKKLREILEREVQPPWSLWEEQQEERRAIDYDSSLTEKQKQEKRELLWTKYQKKEKAAVAKIMEDQQLEESFDPAENVIVYAEFEDHDEIGSCIEHGDFFSWVQSLRFSHH